MRLRNGCLLSGADTRHYEPCKWRQHKMLCPTAIMPIHATPSFASDKWAGLCLLLSDESLAIKHGYLVPFFR
jgi:hypothetical protein